MCVGKKLPITPSCSAADYAPASSTQPRRQTGNTVSTVAIPPPSRQHQKHRSRRRSRRARSLRVRRRNISPSSDEDQRGGAIGRDGWAEKGLDERKGSDEAADIKEGVPPPWWRTENRKRGCKLSFFLIISIPSNPASLLFPIFASKQSGNVRRERMFG